LRISSGFRCVLHPIEQKKNNPGPHTTGKAADILTAGSATHGIILELGQTYNHDEPYFAGIGLSQKGPLEDRFIHLDACIAAPWRPRPHVWTY